MALQPRDGYKQESKYFVLFDFWGYKFALPLMIISSFPQQCLICDFIYDELKSDAQIACPVVYQHK